MAVYVALLRGINVGGNALKMQRLQELCETLGFETPRTYLQSGNLVFTAGDSAAKCAAAIEKALLGETRLPVSVIVKSRADWKRIIAANPLLNAKAVDRAKLHVTFLREAPGPEAIKRLAAVNSGDDVAHVHGKQVYLYCPNGYGRTKLANNAIERILAIGATTRNWNTVTMLGQMFEE